MATVFARSVSAAAWRGEDAETAGLRAFLKAVSSPLLDELVTFDLPTRDIYGQHWSVDGRDAPDLNSPANAVYLPGRNILLTIKPAIWCGLHGIGCLALATLDGNPFPDATGEFFDALEKLLALATDNCLTIIRPFAKLRKDEVVRLGKAYRWGLRFPVSHRSTGGTAAAATSAQSGAARFSR